MLFVMDEERKSLQDLARKFAEEKIRPIAAEWDIKGDTPMDLYQEASELGFTSLAWPEELGGAGISHVAQVGVFEELSRGDAGFANALAASTLASRPILMYGSDEQQRYAAEHVIGGDMAGFALTEPNAGSDAGAIIAKAVKVGDEYVLNAHKCFITNGPHAKFFVVFAKTNPSLGIKGISAFLVEADRPGVSIGKHEDKMGIRLSTASDVILEDVHVPVDHLLGPEGKGFKIAMQTMDIARVECAACANGISQRALDLSIEYAKTRVTFGKPIASLQAIRFMLADMEIRTQLARSLTYRAAELIDAGQTDSKLCACAKAAASEAAMQNAMDAAQIYSGYGYSREYPVEKLMRDAKIYMIFDGTSQIQRVVISGNLLK